MTTPRPQLLPEPVLFDLLPASFEPWGASAWYQARPPTDASVSIIQAELGIRLPPLLLEVARACPSYGGWFGGVGDDLESHNHILSINRNFREQGLPARYVLFNHGHDGDCDAWDKEGPVAEAAAGAGDERPIVYFNYDGDRRQLRALRVVASSFAGYVDAFVRAHAARCPVKRLRRRAKRVLARYGAT